MTGTLNRSHWEGAWRQESVQVRDQLTGDIVHEGLPHVNLSSFMQTVCEFANDTIREPFVHPLAQAAILHFLIGYIHPFADGNGRTARALMYWLMIRRGYWLTEYMVISKAVRELRSSYEKAYLHSENDGLDVTYFVRQQLRTIAKAYEQFEGYLRRQRKKRRALREEMIAGHNARQLDVISRLQRDPDHIFTIKALVGQFGISPPTAAADLNQLVDEGLLRRTQRGRKYFYTGAGTI